MSFIGFNRPYLTGKEYQYIEEAIDTHKISGNGVFTQKCHNFFQSKYGFRKCLLTTSCTDALEMAALLLDCKPGDEVIVPSYTFTSTANPFILRGAKIVFADSGPTHPNLDITKLESLINSNTKAIVVVHYAGVACDMDAIMELSEKYSIDIVEDAAQAIDSYYKGRPLGSIGHLAAFSFHETKNVISGEGGMLVINDEKYLSRSEIIWEKGTNRAEFFRGEVDKYGWVDVGSSFLPSEITAAFLYAQLESMDEIQTKRLEIWNRYYTELMVLEKRGLCKVPLNPGYATNNAHLFYILLNSNEERDRLITFLKDQNINAVFHYLSLHNSPFYHAKHDERELLNSDRFSNCLVRLPFYVELSKKDQDRVISGIRAFFD